MATCSERVIKASTPPSRSGRLEAGACQASEPRVLGDPEAPSGTRRFWPGTSCPAQVGFAEDEFGWRGVASTGRRPQGRSRARGVTRARPIGADVWAPWRPPHPAPSSWAPLPGRLQAEGGPYLPSLPSPALPRIPAEGALYSFIYLECVYMWGRARAMERVRSEDNLRESVFSFHHVGSGNRTQIDQMPSARGNASGPTSS